MARNPKSAAEQALEDGRKRQAEAVAETERLTTQSTPTPTQEENDRAKLGILDIDDKEDDGSGPDRAIDPVRDVAPAAKPGYQTRDAKAK